MPAGLSRTLALQGNDEFDPLAKGVGAFTRALILLGLARDPTLLSPEDRILETFADRLAVLSPTKTRVLSIEFTSRDPDLAAKGANAVADAYIDMQAEAKRANAHSAAQSLGALVDELRISAAQADAKAEEFRLKSGLLVGNNNTTISSQQLGDLNNQLSISRTAQADAQAKARLLREMLRQNRIADIPDVANNEHIRRLSEQRVTLRAQLALELRTLMPGHPRIKELQAQLAELDQAGRAAAERAVRALENDARIAGARVENLAHALEEQKKVAGVAGADEVHLRELERSAKLLKEHFEIESAKYQEALARERVRATPADARMIQRALAPQQPSFPKKLPITVFATLAGFILSAGGIIAGELLSGRAAVTPSYDRRPEIAKEPIVAVPIAPSAEAETPTVAASSDAATLPARDATSDEERQTEAVELLSRIDSARMTYTCVSVLAVDCEEPPRAFDAIVTLSRALSRRGRTILVAAQSSDQRYEHLVADPQMRPQGLADLVSGDAAFAETIHRDTHSRLHVLPAGKGDGEAQYEVPLVVEALAHTYDFLVFATFVQAQALELAPLFNIALVREIDSLHSLREELAHAGCEVFDLDAGPADLAA